MSTERKVCCFCTQEGYRSHNCPCQKPPGPYRFLPINTKPETQKPAKAALEAK
jgi:hypothetical protein